MNMETRHCFLCDQNKPIVSFKKGRNGIRHSTCRDCSGLGTGKGDFIYLRKWTFDRYKPETEHIVEAFEFLRDMGYIVEGDIHSQFCKKWGLEYKEQEEVLYDKDEILKLLK